MLFRSFKVQPSLTKTRRNKMTYSEFLITFIKQYKSIQDAKCCFEDMGNKEWAETKQSEGFAVRDLAFALYPEYHDAIRDVCTDIRVLAKQQHSLR